MVVSNGAMSTRFKIPQISEVFLGTDWSHERDHEVGNEENVGDLLGADI